MQHDRPTPQELAEAVREFLQDEILPILDDHRLKFRTLVAINGLGIAERELWATTPPSEQDWELARRIRAGDVPEDAVALLKEQVAEAPRLEPRATWRSTSEAPALPDASRRRVVRGRSRPPAIPDVPLTARGARAGGGGARRARGRRVRPRRRERPAAHGRDGRIVAPGHEAERWPEFAEWRGGRLDAIPPEELEAASSVPYASTTRPALPRRRVARRGARPRPSGSRPARRARVGTALAVFHGGVNRIVISYALSGDRTYFGTFEQAPACINLLDLGDDGWIVRTVNYVPYDPLHPARTTTMEHLWEQLRPYHRRARELLGVLLQRGTRRGSPSRSASAARRDPPPRRRRAGAGESTRSWLGIGFQRQGGMSNSGSPRSASGRLRTVRPRP